MNLGQSVRFHFVGEEDFLDAVEADEGFRGHWFLSVVNCQLSVVGNRQALWLKSRHEPMRTNFENLRVYQLSEEIADYHLGHRARVGPLCQEHSRRAGRAVC